MSREGKDESEEGWSGSGVAGEEPTPLFTVQV